MKNKFLLLFIILAIKCSAQIQVYAPENEVRLDVASYFSEYPIIIERLGYDSLDANGLVTHGSYFDADSLITGSAMRTSYKYDKAGRKVSYKAWKDLNGTKKIFTNEQISYSASGKILTYKVVIHGSSVEHIDSISKSNFDSLVYDANDSLILKLVSYPDENGSWVNALKFSYTYFPNGKLQQSSFYKWENEQWSLYDANTYRYATSLTADSTIINNSKIHLTFKNSIGKDSVKIIQVLDSGKWENESKHTYVYSKDSVSSTLQIISYAWSEQLTEWKQWPYLYETWKYTSDMKFLGYSIGNYIGNYNYTFLVYAYYPDGKIKTEKYGYQITPNRRYSSHFYTYKKTQQPALDSGLDFSIYPNPASGNIVILAHLISNTKHTIKLYDSLGKLMIEESVEASLGISKIELSTENLASGFYFLSLSDTQNTRIKKVILTDK